MYKTVDGDTWDMIAKKVYGDESKADVLMENNVHLLNIFIFSGGIEIKTPEISHEETALLPPWR